MKASLSHRRLLAVIKLVPEGSVATYGQIAKLAGLEGHARQVVWVLHSSSRKYKLPWHRIINSQGRIGLPNEYAQLRQRNLLLKEGIEFDLYGKIDLKKFGWKPRLSALKKIIAVSIGE